VVCLSWLSISCRVGTAARRPAPYAAPTGLRRLKVDLASTEEVNVKLPRTATSATKAPHGPTFARVNTSIYRDGETQGVAIRTPLAGWTSASNRRLAPRLELVEQLARYQALGSPEPEPEEPGEPPPEEPEPEPEPATPAAATTGGAESEGGGIPGITLMIRKRSTLSAILRL
jgi:hypothetical protein